MNEVLQCDAKRFADFIQTNYPDAKQWMNPIGQTAWYIGHGFIAVVCDADRNEIVALVAARPVERPGLGVLPVYYNERGTCMHCDLLIDTSQDNRALMSLKLFCQLRFPQCTTITMFRHFEEGLRTYDLNKFWRGFEKIKKVRRKKKEQEHEPAELF